MVDSSGSAQRADGAGSMSSQPLLDTGLPPPPSSGRNPLVMYGVIMIVELVIGISTGVALFKPKVALISSLSPKNDELMINVLMDFLANFQKMAA